MADGQTTHLVAMAAGVGASVAWVASSLAFGAAAARIGPTLVNGLRLAFAVTILWSVHAILNGSPVPSAEPRQVLCLAASGLIGLAIGDQLFFTALVDLGPRISLLVSMTTSPIFAAALGLGFLGEVLRPIDCIAIAATIGGIAWVITERSHADDPAPDRRHTRRGLICALCAGACQATGGLLSKMGMGHGEPAGFVHMDPLGATAWRMGFGFVCVLPIVVWHLRRTAGRVRHEDASDRRARVRRGVACTGIGAVCGPVLGVWMSLTAYAGAPLGIAQTLCSLSPVLVLPVLAWTGRDRVTARAILGALLAVAGSAMLFLFA